MIDLPVSVLTLFQRWDVPSKRPLVYIALFGCLGALLGPSSQWSSDAVRMARAQGDVAMLQLTLDQHRQATGSYPAPDEGLDVLVTEGRLKSRVEDPWGHSYHYRLEGTQGSVVSYGADDQPGGSGADADIWSANPRDSQDQIDRVAFWPQIWGGFLQYSALGVMVWVMVRLARSALSRVRHEASSV